MIYWQSIGLQLLTIKESYYIGNLTDQHLFEMPKMCTQARSSPMYTDELQRKRQNLLKTGLRVAQENIQILKHSHSLCPWLSVRSLYSFIPGNMSVLAVKGQSLTYSLRVTHQNNKVRKCWDCFQCSFCFCILFAQLSLCLVKWFELQHIFKYNILYNFDHDGLMWSTCLPIMFN